MRYLIDTNVFIKVANGSNLLSDDVKEIIENYENIIYVSSESIKEFIHLLQNEKIAPKKGFSISNVFGYVENALGFSVKYVAREHLQIRSCRLNTS